MKTGKHYSNNASKLEKVSDQTLAAAIKKCEEHIRYRIAGRTKRGAHTESRLGKDPFDYYLEYAVDAIVSGSWEWKEKYALSQQMIRIIDSTISTEVEKVQTTKAQEHKVIYTDAPESFFTVEPEEGPVDMVQEILFNKQVSVIEETIKGNVDFETFWECVKDGMKPDEIAAFMEKSTKQVYKIKEMFLKKIKQSPYFEAL